MKAEELLHQGDPEGALGALQDAIRGDPSNAKLRVFLFQLLCVTGAWERALSQLDVAGQLDPINLAMVQTYREAVRCEVFRRQVFSGEKSPLVFGDPPQWSALLLEALRLYGSGEYAKSDELRALAFDQAPATAGSLDDQPFQWLADADPRLGPVLEAIINGRYYWIPFQRLLKVDLDPPEDLRDLVWLPARLTFQNEGESVALIPTRYPGSELADDAQLRLSQKTEWEEPSPRLFTGLGQRLLATDVDEYPLLNVRHITLESVKSEAVG